MTLNPLDEAPGPSQPCRLRVSMTMLSQQRESCPPWGRGQSLSLRFTAQSGAAWGCAGGVRAVSFGLTLMVGEEPGSLLLSVPNPGIPAGLSKVCQSLRTGNFRKKEKKKT